MTHKDELLQTAACDITCFIGATKMIADERILHALRQSKLIIELRDVEVDTLMKLFTIEQYDAGDIISRPNDPVMRDALLILIEGKVEVTAVADGEPIKLLLKDAGDMARIISFVGSNVMKIEATVRASRDSTLLMLSREKLEALLDTSHHRIVYYLMRGLVRHAHNLARHKSAETEELSNYFYRLHALY